MTTRADILNIVAHVTKAAQLSDQAAQGESDPNRNYDLENFGRTLQMLAKHMTALADNTPL